MGLGLLTDLYELKMAASYLRRGMDATATFSLYVRGIPPRRGFVVAAGLEGCLDYLESLRFDDEDLFFLREVGFRDDDVDRFRALRFTGEAWAVPEGRVVFAGEPLLEVTGPIAEAQLAETFLLNRVTVEGTLASTALRGRRKWVSGGIATSAIAITVAGLFVPQHSAPPPVDVFMERHISLHAGVETGGQVLFAVNGP